MFAKLLKHELKSTGTLLGVLCPAALAVSAIGGFVLRGVMNAPATDQGIEAASLLAGLLLPFVFLSLFAFAIGGEIYLAVQFYRRKFTDQGYLTFTLPVRSWQIYLTSLLNILFWSVLIGIVTVVSFVGIFVIALYNTEVLDAMREAMAEMPLEMELAFSEFSKWSTVSAVVSFVSGNVLLITSITLGCVLAKKHKILASIGCYYLISIIISSLSTSIGVQNGSDVEMMYMTSALFYAAAAVIGSVFSIWLMDRKLNLP